ncbi:MAG: STM3941 family protein [Ferruginibacter sp.]
MTIPANRKRFPVVFVSGLLASVLLILLIIDTLKHFNDKGHADSILIGAYIGLTFWVVILTVIALLEYIKTTFSKQAVLIITDKGIHDNLSIFSVGDISWAEITDLRIVKLLRTDFLVISVTNPQSFIHRISKLKQRPLKSYLKKFGSPIVISQRRINYNLEDLKEILLNTKAGYINVS